jgi:hypothetical protein
MFKSMSKLCEFQLISHMNRSTTLKNELVKMVGHVLLNHVIKFSGADLNRSLKWTPSALISIWGSLRRLGSKVMELQATYWHGDGLR